MSREDSGCEVVITRSGARAMRDRATGELMHPVIGPLVEAERLYVAPSRLAARLRVSNGGPLVLLDVGLGAGSNAIAAWRVSEAMPEAARRLELQSFDRDLSALELALHPEHASAFGLEGSAGAAARTLLAEHRHQSSRTRWRLLLGELPAMLHQIATDSVDIVFWDPFSPRANPALWTLSAFAALRPLCREGATVHTYSAATATRSALLLAGFAVGIGESTGEEKQTTLAAVSVNDLARPLDRSFLDRLARSSAPFPPDAPKDALQRIAALAQFAQFALSSG
jgi:queuine tRNA-ribosyltransferase